MAKLRGKNDYPIYFGAKAEGLRLASDLRRNTTNIILPKFQTTG